MEDPTTSQECKLTVPFKTGQDENTSSGDRRRSKSLRTDLEIPDSDVLKGRIKLGRSDLNRKPRTTRKSGSHCRYMLGRVQAWLRELLGIIRIFTGYYDRFIVLVVWINTAVLVAQTFESVNVRGGYFISALDAVLIAIYLTEWLLNTLVLGRVYYKSLANVLDVFIFFSSLIDFLLPVMEVRGGQTSTMFRILKIFKGARNLRVFRVLRNLRFFNNLQCIVNTCIKSIKSTGAILLLMFTCLSMFAVIFREMFSKSDPGRFGTMFRTVYTLFQLLTLDDWSFIYTTSRDNGAPHIIYFLVLYIVVEYFIFLNLFIAVLVDNFQQTIKKRMASRVQKYQDVFENEMQEITKLDQTSEMQSDVQFYEKALGSTYSNNEYGQREKKAIIRYLNLLAAIDQNQHTFRSQTSTLERLTDTVFEASEENLHTN